MLDKHILSSWLHEEDNWWMTCGLRYVLRVGCPRGEERGPAGREYSLVTTGSPLSYYCKECLLDFQLGGFTGHCGSSRWTASSKRTVNVYSYCSTKWQGCTTDNQGIKCCFTSHALISCCLARKNPGSRGQEIGQSVHMSSYRIERGYGRAIRR